MMDMMMLYYHVVYSNLKNNDLMTITESVLMSFHSKVPANKAPFEKLAQKIKTTIIMIIITVITTFILSVSIASLIGIGLFHCLFWFGSV